MNKMIIVPTGGRDVIDFSRDDALYTADLEACVAVGGTNGYTGALMHLTQISPVEDFMQWFTRIIPPSESSRIYLVGGMKGKAEHFVEDLRRELKDRHYSPPKEKVLAEHLINLRLRKNQAEWQTYRHYKTPFELVEIPMGAGVL